MNLERGKVHCVACLVMVTVSALPLGACQDAKRVAELAPQLVAPSAAARVLPEPVAAEVQGLQLPPEQVSSAFDFESEGVDEAGRLLYRVRIRRNGNPFLVATGRLTPLFWANGKTAPDYVADAYFAAHPSRTPSSIQPGDEFILTLPSDTFVVRWQEDREERFGHRAKVREYVSERGDQLRYYLTVPFPIRYEFQPADAPNRGVLRFGSDLAFMLGTGRTDVLRMAQLIYRVYDPDIFQMEAVRKLVAEAKPGREMEIDIDRSHTYLDPVREVLPRATATEPVSETSRSDLRRYIFGPDQGSPFMAVEDALGTQTSLDALRDSRPFRIEYRWDGTVRVYYKTGPDDALGKRDAFALRENARWAALYQTLTQSSDWPVKWAGGEPSDLDPFPTARDGRQRGQDRQSYSFLVPGRVLVLTFSPRTFQSDARAEGEFRDLLAEMRERYQPLVEQVMDLIDRLQVRRNPEPIAQRATQVTAAGDQADDLP